MVKRKGAICMHLFFVNIPIYPMSAFPRHQSKQPEPSVVIGRFPVRIRNPIRQNL